MKLRFRKWSNFTDQQIKKRKHASTVRHWNTCQADLGNYQSYLMHSISSNDNSNFPSAKHRNICLASIASITFTTKFQSMAGDTCDRKCACLTVQSHMPNKNFVVAIATHSTVTFCFHNSALSCFILKDIFDMHQQ